MHRSSPPQQCKHKIYLNNAASAWPRAPGVVEAVAQCLQQPPEHPGRTVSSSSDAVTECRRRLASLLGVEDATRIVLAQNATHALNLAIHGVAWEPSDYVVTTVTEHNSVLRPLAHLQARLGIQLIVVGLDPEGNIDQDAFDQALKQSPRLVALNHASNVTGRINAVTPLFQRASRAGAVTLLDASQSLGHIPVEAVALGADMVAFTGHKGLRGPAGTGGLYVAPHLELEQVYIGGTGVRSDLRLHPPEMPTRLEAGTPNVPALSGLAAALRWLEQDGENAGRREASLAGELWEGLRQISGVTLYDDDERAARLGVVSFRIDGWDIEEVGYILNESFGVICRTGLHCAPLIHEAIGSAPHGTVRFSVSGFNTEEEIRSACQAVRQIAG